jgi:lysine-N-methylase
MCCLLGPDGRCDLQSAYGEEALPDVCFHFPRLTIDFDGVLEQAATFSCPEVARLALLDPAALDITDGDEVKLRPSGALRIAGASLPPGAPLGQARRIRHLALDVLRAGGVRIEARLVALGWVVAVLGQGAVSERRVRESFRVAMAGLSDLDQQLARTVPDHLAHVDLVRQLALAALDAGGSMHRFRTCVNEAGQALFLYNEGTGADRSRGAFLQGVEGMLKPYLLARPWLFPNLLANTLQASTFPFRAGRSMVDEFLLFVGRFLLVRLLLVGVGLHRERLTDDTVVAVVQAVHRVLDHAASSDQRMLALLRDAGLADAGALAAHLVI